MLQPPEPPPLPGVWRKTILCGRPAAPSGDPHPVNLSTFLISAASDRQNRSGPVDANAIVPPCGRFELAPAPGVVGFVGGGGVGFDAGDLDPPWAARPRAPP